MFQQEFRMVKQSVVMIKHVRLVAIMEQLLQKNVQPTKLVPMGSVEKQRITARRRMLAEAFLTEIQSVAQTELGQSVVMAEQ